MVLPCSALSIIHTEFYSGYLVSLCCSIAGNHLSVSVPAVRKALISSYGARDSFLGSPIRGRPALPLVVSDFCFCLSLLGHLRQMTASGVNEPVANLLSMSIDESLKR